MVKYGQQWTTNKGYFAHMLWGRTRLNLRVILAWMAVETGGMGDGSYNYLQIVGTAAAGSVNGMKAYKNVYESVRDAAFNVKRRKEIGQSVGKGPDAQMRAITRAWARGPGNAARSVDENPNLHGYYERFVEHYNAINPADVKKLAHTSGTYAETLKDSLEGAKKGGREIGKPAAAESTNPAEEIAAAVGRAIWKPLLSTALAGTGLALIAYGFAKATGAGKVAEHVKQAAGTAATVGAAL